MGTDKWSADLDSPEWDRRRKQMIEDLAGRKKVADPKVLRAMSEIPRHRFVPPEFVAHAYEDRPLPIGHLQTISQPFIVARVAELLALSGHERVLEIGAGSGYQAAVLGRLCREVVGLEWHAALVESARRLLFEIGTENVHLYQADGKILRREEGSRRWDRVLASCACSEPPASWYDQLAPGGILVFPWDRKGEQRLVRWTKSRECGPGPAWSDQRDIFGVRFVPLL